MLEGRTPEQKKRLIEEVTQAVTRTIGVPEMAVSVFIQETKYENHGQGGKQSQPR